VAGIGEGDDDEVLALGSEPVQEGDALVDRDFPIGGAKAPERRDGQLLQVGLGSAPELVI
jgi:hypothetical protein